MREAIINWYEKAAECKHRRPDWVCLKDSDKPHRCNLALCPEEKLDLRDRAKLLEGGE